MAQRSLLERELFSLLRTGPAERPRFVVLSRVYVFSWHHLCAGPDRLASCGKKLQISALKFSLFLNFQNYFVDFEGILKSTLKKIKIHNCSNRY